MFCGTTWDSTGKDCATRCVDDDDCEGKDQWCYWVECEDTEANRENGLDIVKEPTTEATVASCNAEVSQCPSGQLWDELRSWVVIFIIVLR